MWPDVHLVSGAAFIYREQQQRYVPIKFSVRGRDLGGAVLEAQHAVSSPPCQLPGGYRLEWVGEFGNLQEAIARLSVAVPLSIALIVLLLYLNFGSLRDALLAASVIPMALVGGIFALWVTGTPFSVSSAIGFVALFGIAAMDGILMLSYYHLSLDSGLDRASAMLQTCRTQLRPVMMTCIVACVGLMPAAFSTGIGSQVQRPLALVVVGGMLLAPVLILLVLPVLILKFSRAREMPRKNRGRPPSEARAPHSCPCSACAVLGACVGPNFHRPAPPQVERYTAEPLPAATASAAGPGGAAQRFLDRTGRAAGLVDAIRLRRTRLRWSTRRCAPIPNVQSAQAALRQALENTAAQRGSYFPSVQSSFDASRNRNAVGVLAPNLASGTALYNLYTPQVTVSYVPDVFGANRRQVESLAAQAEAEPLPARRHLPDADGECGDRGDPGSRIAGADCRHRARHRTRTRVAVGAAARARARRDRRGRRVRAGRGARATGGHAAAAAPTAAASAGLVGRTDRTLPARFKPASNLSSIN